jgi:hypothetical protein
MSPWKKNENARHEREYNLFMDCFETVKEAHSKGESKPSYTKMFLEEQEKSGVREEEGQYRHGNRWRFDHWQSDAELYPRNVPVSAVAGGEMREEMQQVCGDKNIPCGRTERSCQRSELW